MSETPEDDAFAEILAEYDDSWRGGNLAWPPTEILDLNLRDRLQRAQGCLEFLEEVWPRRTPVETTEPKFPSRIGRYHLLHELGRGGFGIVYLGMDKALKREVAVKVPRPEVLLSPELRERFLREARAAAGLDHPNLVPVLDTGEDQGVCYIITAYCSGKSLRSWLDDREGGVPVGEAARIVQELAGAVEHIHHKGIIHRDIKPGNILMHISEAASESYTTNSAAVTPKLTDFGLAKIMEPGQELTASHARLGTPLYMAPEQVVGPPEMVGTETDVYALGVVLYELLTGRPPFQGADALETMDLVRGREPVPPRQLRPAIPPDIETVCLKCLSKEPTRRYHTAAELAEDLTRFLEGKPVRARRRNWLEKVAQWSRRHPSVASLLLLVALAFTLLFGGVAWHIQEISQKTADLEDANKREKDLAREADLQRKQAEKEALFAKQQSYTGTIFQARQYLLEGRPHLAASLLNNFRPKSGEEDLRGFEWYYLWPHASKLIVFAGPNEWVTYSPSGKLLASADHKGNIHVCSSTGQLLRKLSVKEKLVMQSLCFSIDNKYLLALVSDNSRAKVIQRKGSLDSPCNWIPSSVTIWDIASGECHVLFKLNLEAYDMALSPQGDSLVIAGLTSNLHGMLQSMDPVTRELRWQNTLEGSPPIRNLKIRFNKTGKKFVVTWIAFKESADFARLQIIDDNTGKLLYQFADAAGHGYFISAFSPDDRWFALARVSGQLRLYESNCEQEKIQWLHESIQSLSFSHDNKYLALGVIVDQKLPSNNNGKDPGVRVWNLNSGHYLPQEIHEGSRTVAFSPVCNQLAAGCEDGQVRLLHLDRVKEFIKLAGHSKEAWGVAFSPDSQVLATCSDDNTIKLWNVSTGIEKSTLKGHESLVTDVAFSPDGKILASGSYDCTIRLWDSTSGKHLRTFQGHSNGVRSVGFSSDGKCLASSGRDKLIKLWDVSSGKEIATLTTHTDVANKVAFSPKSDLLVTTGNDRVVTGWNYKKGYNIWRKEENGKLRCAAFHPNGKLIAVGTQHGRIKVHKALTGESISEMWGHDQEIRAVKFSADGKTIASAGADKVIRLWNLATGREMLTLKGHKAEINDLAFSPDGRWLASASHDGEVILWPARSSK